MVNWWLTDSRQVVSGGVAFCLWLWLKFGPSDKPLMWNNFNFSLICNGINVFYQHCFKTEGLVTARFYPLPVVASVFTDSHCSVSLGRIVVFDQPLSYNREKCLTHTWAMLSRSYFTLHRVYQRSRCLTNVRTPHYLGSLSCSSSVDDSSCVSVSLGPSIFASICCFNSTMPVPSTWAIAFVTQKKDYTFNNKGAWVDYHHKLNPNCTEIIQNPYQTHTMQTHINSI